MNKINNFFKHPQKPFLRTVYMAIILICLGAGTSYAAGTIAENYVNGYKNTPKSSTIESESTAASESGPITLAQAKEIALADAGFTESEVIFTEEKQDMDNGISVYDLNFYAENAEFEYEINADTGAIYSRSRETVVMQAEGTVSETSQADAANSTPESDALSSSTNTAQSEAASSNATSVETDSNTASTETAASSGTASGASSASGSSSASDPASAKTDTSPDTTATEAAAASNSGQTTESSQISLETAKNTALSDAGVSASSVTVTKAKLDRDDGISIYDIEFYTATHEYEYEINASTGAIHDKSVEAFQATASGAGSISETQASQSSSGSYISVDEAKSIAVSQAGLSVSDVNFKKAKLDTDDGQAVYEIEFYHNNVEYECEINASTGAVLEYDYDWDD